MATGFVWHERMMWHDAGPSVAVLPARGGYSAEYVPFCGLAVVEALSGVSTGCLDPFAPMIDAMPGQELQSHQSHRRRARLRSAAAVGTMKTLPHSRLSADGVAVGWCRQTHKRTFRHA